MSKLVKSGLPWILAALLVVMIPFADNIFNFGYAEISYNEHNNSVAPSAGQTPEPSAELPHESNTPEPSATLPHEDVTPTLPAPSSGESIAPEPDIIILVLNTSSKKIHMPDCSYVNRMSDKNKEMIETDDIALTVAELAEQGYTTCSTCMKGF